MFAHLKARHTSTAWHTTSNILRSTRGKRAPGGGVTGIPGHNAAQVVLGDLAE